MNYSAKPKQGTLLQVLLLLVLATWLLFTNSASAAETNDPFISANRSVHGFNQVVDSFLLKPLARTYLKVTPRLIKKGIKNIFNNLDDVQVVINDLLQLKLRQASSDFGRLAVNSTVGLGGVINIAGDVLGIEKHDEDFGQTLAHWGVGTGSYVVLPLLGPSTIRESAGLFTGLILNPFQSLDTGTQEKAYSVAAVDSRASLLSFDDLIMGDKYLFIREIYLQRLEYSNNDENMELSMSSF